jgi:hypothetical protein
VFDRETLELQESLKADRKKLTSLHRMSDVDYPGALVALGDNLRCCVNMDANRYVIQSLQVTSAGVPFWKAEGGNRGSKSLSDLVAKFSASIDGLSVALAALPDDPALASPAFNADRAQILNDFCENDWRRQDYERVLLQDGNLRLVVDTFGENYRLQYLLLQTYFNQGVSDRWETRLSTPSIAVVIDRLERDRGTHSQNFAFRPGLLAACADYPLFASEGVWAVLPERPSVLDRS